MEENLDIIERSKEFVTKLLTEQLGENYTYHNLQHSLDIQSRVIEIGQNSGVSEEELEILQVAALFHDTGFTKTYEDHEVASAEIADGFLKSVNYDAHKTEEVKKCILGTKMGTIPETNLQKIIVDADMLSLNSDIFWERSEMLRKEWSTVCGRNYSEKEWIEMGIGVFENITPHTEYVRTKYADGRAKNLELLKQKLTQAADGKPKKKKEKSFGRGVETMFRVTSKNHIQLSAIADNKANIMLSINAIIISISVSTLIPQLRTEEYLVVPTMVLLAVCIATIVFATLSTVPQITKGKFTRQDIEEKKANLLFFGNFHSVEQEHFEWGFSEMINDPNYLYLSMTRDLYHLGRVLHKKYKYLRICYRVFMYGLIIAVITFVAFFQLYPHQD